MNKYYSVLNNYQLALIGIFLLLALAPAFFHLLAALIFPLEVAIIFFIKNEAEAVAIDKAMVIDIVAVVARNRVIWVWPKDGI